MLEESQLSREDLIKIERLKGMARRRRLLEQMQAGGSGSHSLYLDGNGHDPDWDEPAIQYVNGLTQPSSPLADQNAAMAPPSLSQRERVVAGLVGRTNRHAMPLFMVQRRTMRNRRSVRARQAMAGSRVRRRTAWLFGSFFGTLLLITLLLIGGGVGVAAGFYFYYTRDLPSIENLAARADTFQTTEIYDRNGTLLYKIWDQGKRTYKRLDEISPYVISATLAVENPTFYTDAGVDTWAIIRAAYINLTHKGQSGGSTITQQLVRRVLLPEGDEQSLARKVREATLALRLTQRYTKNEILEIYLNQIYYGNLSYGIEAASETYYNRPVNQLDLAQAALLAGLPQLPSDYDPVLHFDLAKQRQTHVLDQMVKKGFASQQQADAALREDVRPNVQSDDTNTLAPHFVNYVRAQLVAKYGVAQVNRGGLKVTTTLDLNYQQLGQRIVADQVAKLADQNAHNAALVALKPGTGEILAMVGSVDYRNPQFGQVNVTVAPRQPGSSFKPIVYALAFRKGWTPATMISDITTAFPDGGPSLYIPSNYDNREHGPVLVRKALAGSLNIPAVKTLQYAGVQDTLTLAHDLGINSLSDNPDQYGLSLVLGGGEVTLLEMTGAYAAFANQGQFVPPVSILEVQDASGNVLEKYDPNNAPRRQVLSPEVSYLISDILSDNQARSFIFGADNALKLSRPAAAKTGTTNDYRDNWTLGYTPYLAVGVWLGNNDNAPLKQVAGARGAGPIWHDFMEAVFGNPPLEDVLRDAPDKPLQIVFPRPADIVTEPVCGIDGLKPSAACTAAKDVHPEIFIKDSEPQAEDNIYHFVRVCNLPNHPVCIANPYCPLTLTVDLPFPTLPDEYSNWAAKNNVGAPTKVCDQPAPPTPSAVTIPLILNPQPNLPPNPAADSAFPNLQLAITSPTAGSTVRGMVQLNGSATADSFGSYSLDYSPDGSFWTPVSGTVYHTAIGNGFLDNWNTDLVPEGVYQLRLTISSQDGAQARYSYSSVRVERSAPVVSIASPTDGSHFNPGDNVLIQATVGGSSIAQVEFYVDGVPVGYVDSAPYQFTWPALAGPHKLTVIARSAGGSASTSTPVNIDATPPQMTPTPAGSPTVTASTPIRIFYPTDGAYIYSDQLELQAIVNSPLITRVVFAVDGKTLGESGPPWMVNWTTTPGDHTITATAYDAQGAQLGNPVSVQVTVKQ
jgi:1A family penicillin-binding protein